MSDVLSAQHPPAMRVGGRRLSISARPRPHHIADGAAPTPAPAQPAETPDYPRPAAQAEGDDQAQAQAQGQHPPPHNEEETPKKDKKHGHGGHDQNRLKESVYRKLDATTPSKDHLARRHSFGAGGRIGQPMGKALAV